MTPETLLGFLCKVNHEAFLRGVEPGFAAEKIWLAAHAICPLVGIDPKSIIDSLIEDTKAIVAELKGGAE